MGNQVIDILIPFIEAVRGKNDFVSEDEKYRMGGARYILGQMVRQIWIPKDHFYISTGAKELWSKISNKSIRKYHYQDQVICENEEPVSVKSCVGSSRTFDEDSKKVLVKGVPFKYRDVFHDEHMIPVSDTIERLCALESLNYENVGKILDNIYICKILKTEDKVLRPRYHRPEFLDDVIKNVYEKNGITVQKLDDFENELNSII